jgi:hypothetical protein
MQPNTKSYTAIINSLRDISRDYLRMLMINSVRTELLDLNVSIDNTKKFILEKEKDVAICDYKLSKLDEADPEFEDKSKDLNEYKVLLGEAIAGLSEKVIDLTKEVEKVNLRITDITEGKILVSREDLEAETNKLIKEVTKAAAVEVAKTLE